MYLTLEFALAKKKLLLRHVLFAPVGLNKDCLGHAESSDGPRAQLACYYGPVLTIVLIRQDDKHDEIKL